MLAPACGTASASSPGLLAIVIVVWQAIRLANINIEVGVTPSMITAALCACLLVIFTVIKFLVADERVPDDLGLDRPGPRDRDRSSVPG